MLDPKTVALDAIAPAVARWRAARCGAARLAATAAQAEKDIIAALGDADIGTVDGRPVVRRDVQERQGFAFGLFRTEHPELADRYITRRRRESLKMPRLDTEAEAS
ncbi:hypothetical protein SAMN05421837_107322 [Amycolatopsis pretoriensis]|uniref:Uncharacterized protein n=1 Tax=Amycolatopsis pretoriensis TaxID=218821 RepID=A0A1H5R7E6_9PSEU|nr:hypothetical protein [Amycolatopsis pretoriensis]SEF34326.1 hypothetical protein SAMN05421837_107322 [Amycolatopsis pretoriensis]